MICLPTVPATAYVSVRALPSLTVGGTFKGTVKLQTSLTESGATSTLTGRLLKLVGMFLIMTPTTIYISHMPLVTLQTPIVKSVLRL